MKKKTYINLNGILYNSEDKVFSIHNRAFKYGDALFETIRVVNGKPCFLDAHFRRLKKGMDLLQMPSSDISFGELEGQIIMLLRKNNINQGGRVRLTTFREGGGFYEPTDGGKSYVIEAEPIADNEYVLNSEGLVVDIYKDLKRHRNVLTEMKTTNSIPYILAAIYKRDMGLDDCLVMNEKNRVSEAISSNVFLYKNNSLYTPSLNEGCVNGIMRGQVLKIADDLHFSVFEGAINGAMLLQADELFLTNAIAGIKWVASFREKKYTNTIAKTISQRLNSSVSQTTVSLN